MVPSRLFLTNPRVSTKFFGSIRLPGLEVRTFKNLVSAILVILGDYLDIIRGKGVCSCGTEINYICFFYKQPIEGGFADNDVDK